MNVKIIKFFDRFFGSLSCGILSLTKPFFRKKYGLDKIAFIQLWGIGETILTLPAIKAFKSKYPNSNVFVICTKRNVDVYKGQDFIDRIIEVKLNPFLLKIFMLRNFKKFDLVIDFEEYLNISAIMAYFIGKFRVGYSHGIRSKLFNKTVRYNDKQHVVQTHMDLVRLFNVDARIEKLVKLRYSVKNKQKALSFLPHGFVVGFGAGVAESAKSRMWPIERFAGLIDELDQKKENFVGVFFGTEDEKELNNSIIKRVKHGRVLNLAGLMNLREFFAFIEECDLVVSNDTGVMHIAAAQGVKTIGLFGPNLPVRWGPYGKRNVSIYKGQICKFSPCINVHKGEVPECRYGSDNKCMQAISVEDVIEHI